MLLHVPKNMKHQTLQRQLFHFRINMIPKIRVKSIIIISSKLNMTHQLDVALKVVQHAIAI